MGDSSHVSIGDEVYINESLRLAACKDTKVQIGYGSLIADAVRIYSGDCHPIYYEKIALILTET